jgi:hypothetical protein
MVVTTPPPVKGTRRPRLMTRIPPSKRLSQMASELSSRTDAEDLAGVYSRWLQLQP